MYVNPFLFGVLCTIAVELVLVIILSLFNGGRGE